MPIHALPQYISFAVETSFATWAGDFSADGYYCYVTGLERGELKQQVVPNTNNVVRPRQRHNHIHTLRSGTTMKFGNYLHSKSSHAAEASAATTTHLAELGRAALGGRDLGWSIGVDTSGAEADDELECDADPGFAVGDWIYLYDTSADRGYFHRIEAIDAGPPVTLTLDRDKEFAINADGSDRTYAVIDVFINAYATTQSNHADHKTLAVLVQDDTTDAVVRCNGCKPAMKLPAISAGTPLEWSFDVMVTTFAAGDDAVKEDFSAVSPIGDAPLVPGKGARSRLMLADFGSPLATVVHRGAIEIEPGVTYQADTGFGTEGVNGYVDDVSQETTVAFAVDWSADYVDDFRAKTHKHAMIEIVDTTDGTNAIAFYFPELEYSEEPVPMNEGSIASAGLKFRAQENSAATSLTGTDLEKWRSGFHILFVA